jgi:hypothetical protein
MVTNKKYNRLLNEVVELEENYKKVLKREEEELKKFQELSVKVSLLEEAHPARLFTPSKTGCGYQYTHQAERASTVSAGDVTLQDVASLVIDGKPIEVKTEETKYVTQHCPLQIEEKTSEVAYSSIGDTHVS